MLWSIGVTILSIVFLPITYAAIHRAYAMHAPPQRPKCPLLVVLDSVGRFGRLQGQGHLRIDVCRIGAQRRERHADETNSFPQRKLSREQLLLIDANVIDRKSAQRAIDFGDDLEVRNFI
jgi:hypothetical protein